mmetsp:Transcript_45207/g.104797  ORF Transcript_45207/g.104797 Transcript_45207/m.104797 type:complete len:269 (+) Transcript_45207:76-882(+)
MALHPPGLTERFPTQSTVPVAVATFAEAAADALIAGESVVENLSTAMVRLCHRGRIAEICAAIHLAAEQEPSIQEHLEVLWLADEYRADVEAFLNGEAAGTEDTAALQAGQDNVLNGNQVDARQQLTPEMVRELLRRTLVIAYLPRTAQEAGIAAVLSHFTEITRLRLATDSAGNSKCFCFVECATEDGALRLLDHCRLGEVVMLDSQQHEWHLRASRARRATAAAPAPQRRRGTRGGRRHQKRSRSDAGTIHNAECAVHTDMHSDSL